MAVIYQLVDPITGEIRYVGCSRRTAEERLDGHLGDARYDKKRPVYKWIRSLRKKGTIPIVETIEDVSEEEMFEREIYWIAFRREEGYRLLNCTNGGDGIPGFKHSEETKKRMAEAHRGPRPPELAKKFAENLAKYRPLSFTPEAIEKRAAKIRGRPGRIPGEEERRRTSERTKGEKNAMYGATGSKNPNSRRVEVDGVEYGSVKEASKAIGIGCGNIRARILKGRGRYLDERPKGNYARLTDEKSPFNKAVRVGDREYRSRKAAAEGEGVSQGTIRKWVKEGKAVDL